MNKLIKFITCSWGKNKFSKSYFIYSFIFCLGTYILISFFFYYFTISYLYVTHFDHIPLYVTLFSLPSSPMTPPSPQILFLPSSLFFPKESFINHWCPESIVNGESLKPFFLIQQITKLKNSKLVVFLETTQNFREKSPLVCY